MIFTRRHNLEKHPDPALYADLCQQDTTRPVFICSGQMESDWQRAGDIHTYYGALWSKHYTDVYRHSFRLNTEFGFEAPADPATLREFPDAWKRLGHLDDQIEDLWAYQAELIRFHIEHLRRLRASSCAGYIHFWLADLVPQVGCGVLDSQRQPKGGYDALRQASQPLHIALEHDGRNPRALWIFNDTPHSHLGAVASWKVYDSEARILLEDEMSFDVIANASQWVIETNWGLIPAECARVELTLRDADGTILTRNTYSNPFQPLVRPQGYPWKFDPYLGFKVFNRPDAPSLADQSANRIVRWVPLTVREHMAEWILRQSLPTWLVSAVAKVVDRLL
jgi:beta-mannosidase